MDRATPRPAVRVQRADQPARAGTSWQAVDGAYPVRLTQLSIIAIPAGGLNA
jgi:hypothetical protein